VTPPLAKRTALATGLSYNVLEWDQDPADSEHTVVLIHGFLDNAHSWTATARALKDHFHVIAPDMRGHGDSDRVGAGGYYHFADYVADLDSLIAKLGRDRVSLVGHSMGGSICSYYAGSHPDGVHKLALLEGLGPPESANSAPEQIKIWVQSWRTATEREPTVYKSIEDAALRLRKRDALLDEALSLELARNGTVADGGGRRFKHDPLHLSRGPSPYSAEQAAEFWRQITAPTLLVDGDQSVFRHAEDEMARRATHLPSPERATVANAGHMLHWHQPDALAAVLTAFLRD